MLKLSLSAAKGNFFDRKKVLDAVDRATVKVLSKFGAFVRRRAQTSIRQRRGTSKPGAPPFSHTGLLRRFILFAYDAASRSVVIGPVLLRPTSEAPGLLEYGGRTTLVHPKSGRRRRASYRARPYMRPAFSKEKASLPDLWKNSIR